MRRTACLLLVGLTLVAGAAPPRAVGAAEPSSASVIAVDDGATLDAQLDTGQVQRLGLLGVLAPAADGLSSCNADQAQARLAALVEDQSLRLSFDGDQPTVDAAGRMLVQAWLPDGRNVAEVLLAESDVYADPTQVTGPLADQLASAQAQAAAARVGVWAPGACQASANPAQLAQLGALVGASTGALQQAQVALNILHQQALSAPRLASTAGWQTTTGQAVGWAQQASAQLRAQAANGTPLAADVVQLGELVQSAADGFAPSTGQPDQTDQQARLAQLSSASSRLGSVSGELSALAAAYGLNDD